MRRKTSSRSLRDDMLSSFFRRFVVCTFLKGRSLSPSLPSFDEDIFDFNRKFLVSETVFRECDSTASLVVVCYCFCLAVEALPDKILATCFIFFLLSLALAFA